MRTQNNEKPSTPQSLCQSIENSRKNHSLFLSDFFFELTEWLKQILTNRTLRLQTKHFLTISLFHFSYFKESSLNGMLMLTERSLRLLQLSFSKSNSKL